MKKNSSRLFCNIRNDEVEFQHPVYRLIFEEMQSICDSFTKMEVQQFTRHTNNEICSTVADLLTSNYKLSTIWRRHEVLQQSEDMMLREIVPEMVMVFKNKKVIELIKETQEEISLAQQNSDLENILLLQQKFIVLNELKMRLSKKLGDRIII
jgi:DNA primase